MDGICCLLSYIKSVYDVTDYRSESDVISEYYFSLLRDIFRILERIETKQPRHITLVVIWVMLYFNGDDAMSLRPANTSLHHAVRASA